MRRLFTLFVGDFLDTTNHLDKLVALVGGVLGLYLSIEVAASATEGTVHGLVLASLGATAVLLFAVLGGSSVEALGLTYVLHPVLSSVGVMVLVAFVVNLPFAWRRYPAG